MLLNVNMYNNIPTIIPRKINILISPLLKNQILYKINIPVKIQNKISSIYVIVFEVFILLLRILKKSNKTPITTPVNEKTKNKFAFLLENFA